MRKLYLIFLLPAAVLAQRTAPPSGPAPAHVTPPDKVVAKIDGKTYTPADIQKLLDTLPPAVRTAYNMRPTETLKSVFLLKYFAEQAKQHHLDSDPELTQTEAWARLRALSQAELSYYRNSYRPPEAEQRAYYDRHPEKWDQAKFQEIMIRFALNSYSPVKRTEAEAKALLENLRQQAENGADFGALARKYSENKNLAAKDGEHPPIERSSPYPEAVKKVLFAMKPSEISQPIRESSAYYLVKLNSIAKLPFSEVESRIFGELQQEHFTEYVKGVDEENRVIVLDNAFFANSDQN